MGVFSPKSNKTNQNKKTSDKKKAIYVYPPKNGKVIFLIIGEPKKSKYSVGIPIIPLYGSFYSSKTKKWYKAKELQNYRVFLNVDEDDLKTLKGKELVTLNFDKEKVLILGEGNGTNS